jgi:uncharacterized protein (DUF58 family)
MSFPFDSSAPADAGVSPALLQRLEWRLRQAMETTLSGDYRSVFRGRGMEFDQVVKYQWGDDLRDIDWNVTARLGEPYRKKFVEERDVCVLLVFEDSPALQFGSTGRTRREVLLETAALLMLIGMLQHDRVGVIYASPRGSWFRRPLAGREAALHTASMLLAEPAPALDGPAEVAVPWPLVLRAAPKHSVLGWLGPFAPEPEHEDWRALARRYQTIGFRADDPWDAGLPAAARLPVFDPVAGQVTELNTGSAVNRAAHAQWVAAREAHFAALFPEERERQVVRTDAPVFEALLEFFHRRAQRVAAGR